MYIPHRGRRAFWGEQKGEAMAEQATTDDATRSKRSRRSVLAGMAGAVGVMAARSLAKAPPALAGVDGDVVLGVDNQPTPGTTGVQSSSITRLHGRSTANS